MKVIKVTTQYHPNCGYIQTDKAEVVDIKQLSSVKETVVEELIWSAQEYWGDTYPETADEIRNGLTKDNTFEEDYDKFTWDEEKHVGYYVNTDDDYHVTVYVM